ncbi:MAG TPA: hypothetical protein PLF22_13055 [Pseudomonadales bacterium]|nr:hypothetical protein [Pseudomonadales bacterium]
MKRILLAFSLFLVAILLWIPASPVVDLIVQSQEVLLGRYSRGHFSVLFLLTLVLWLAAWVIVATRGKPLREALFAFVMSLLSIGGSIFVLLLASGFISKPPRYVEQVVEKVDAETGVVLSGISRHRPPNEHFDLLVKDVPEQLRSYPDAPKGYPPIPVTLTIDKNGFRNQVMRDQYDVVVVGDSFVAGSQVSDDQGWTELLRKQSGLSLYNLGVSGTAPNVYLNNFVMLGRQFKPKTVMVTIFEGNDFRDAEPLKTAADLQQHAGLSNPHASMDDLIQASPVTRGLMRLFSEVLAGINKDAPVPDYQKLMGWMPLALDTPHGLQYYSFTPKKLAYLYTDENGFESSSEWRNTRAVLEQFVRLSDQDHFHLIFVYAPSAPHVVMPLAREKIPADQLLRFARYKLERLSLDADTFKRDVFSKLESEENVMMHWCRQNGVDCVSTTQPLRDAAASGRQVYFTYDQHWTPDGNAVVAEVVGKHLASILKQ